MKTAKNPNSRMFMKSAMKPGKYIQTRRKLDMWKDSRLSIKNAKQVLLSLCSASIDLCILVGPSGPLRASPGPNMVHYVNRRNCYKGGDGDCDKSKAQSDSCQSKVAERQECINLRINIDPKPTIGEAYASIKELPAMRALCVAIVPKVMLQ